MPAETESICVLDDNASVRNSIEQLLDSDGLKAQSFEDAEDFLAYVQSRPMGVALLDVWKAARGIAGRRPGRGCRNGLKLRVPFRALLSEGYRQILR
jgi:CheY-like chemotaxis protein